MLSLHDWRPDLRVQPSRRLCWISIAFHAIALLLVMLLPTAFLIKMILAAGLLLHGISIHWQWVSLTSPKAVTRITWCEDGWILTTQKGLLGPFELAPASRMSADLILLHFRTGSRLFAFSRCCVLLADSLDRDEFRRLQVFLRWQRQQIRNPLGAARADAR